MRQRLPNFPMRRMFPMRPTRHPCHSYLNRLRCFRFHLFHPDSRRRFGPCFRLRH